MIPQYTAASIVSQNKQLATPASVDSIVSSNEGFWIKTATLWDFLGASVLEACLDITLTDTGLPVPEDFIQAERNLRKYLNPPKT